MPEPITVTEAQEPSHPTRIFDLHCDTLDMLAMRDWQPYAGHGAKTGDTGYTDLAHNKAAISLERMEDYAWCQCFAIWVPDLYQGVDAYRFYTQARDYFYRQMKLHADRVEQVRDGRQIDDVLDSGRIAALLTLENSSPIGEDLGIVYQLAQDGVKMVALTWNGQNTVGSGHLTSEGLSTFGHEAVHALEDERIVVDVSHLNDAGFADMAQIARHPFVASHSNARAVCDVPRNLTDDQFRTIRDMGGLVGLNFYRAFITSRIAVSDNDVTSSGTGDAQDKAAPDEVTFDELAAHVEHFLDLDGQDTLALGSDWDRSSVPVWLQSCDTIGNLHHLFEQRFGISLTEKIFFSNARDFFSRNEE